MPRASSTSATRHPGTGKVKEPGHKNFKTPNPAIFHHGNQESGTIIYGILRPFEDFEGFPGIRFCSAALKESSAAHSFLSWDSKFSGFQSIFHQMQKKPCTHKMVCNHGLIHFADQFNHWIQCKAVTVGDLHPAVSLPLEEETVHGEAGRWLDTIR